MVRKMIHRKELMGAIKVRGSEYSRGKAKRARQRRTERQQRGGTLQPRVKVQARGEAKPHHVPMTKDKKVEKENLTNLA